MIDVRRRHPTRRTRSTIFLAAMIHYVTYSYVILTAERSQAAADLHEKVNKRYRCAIEVPVNAARTTHDFNTHVQVYRHGLLSSGTAVCLVVSSEHIALLSFKHLRY